MRKDRTEEDGAWKPEIMKRLRSSTYKVLNVEAEVTAATTELAQSPGPVIIKIVEGHTRLTNTLSEVRAQQEAMQAALNYETAAREEKEEKLAERQYNTIGWRMFTARNNKHVENQIKQRDWVLQQALYNTNPLNKGWGEISWEQAASKNDGGQNEYEHRPKGEYYLAPDTLITYDKLTYKRRIHYYLVAKNLHNKGIQEKIKPEFRKNWGDDWTPDENLLGKEWNTNASRKWSGITFREVDPPAEKGEADPAEMSSEGSYDGR